jgi:aryl-alcohol dehydrogenase-like predicted oxidoreductase
MKQRELNHGSPPVGAIGLGCMGMSWAYGSTATDPHSYTQVIRAAVERGVTLIDTADVYADGDNELLVGQALDGIRDQVTLATKVGMVVENRATLAMRPDASPGHIRKAADASLKRLRADVIDLYFLHRIDPDVPLEDSWGALAELVALGKVRRLGLSEVSAEQAMTAHLIFPVSAIESELSLWTREPLGGRAWPDQADQADQADRAAGPADRGTVGWCAEHDAGFIAYAPLGRGFLTGAITSARFGDGDFRAGSPRFRQDAIDANQFIVTAIKEVADQHGATPAQIALAWILSKGDHVVPIPGSDQHRFLKENAAAADIVLTEQDKQDLNGLPPSSGTRY